MEGAGQPLSRADPVKDLGHLRKQENKMGLGWLNLLAWIVSMVENESSLCNSTFKVFVLERSTSRIRNGVWRLFHKVFAHLRARASHVGLWPFGAPNRGFQGWRQKAGLHSDSHVATVHQKKPSLLVPRASNCCHHEAGKNRPRKENGQTTKSLEAWRLLLCSSDLG